MHNKKEVFKIIVLYYTSSIFVINSQDFMFDLSFLKKQTKNKQILLIYVYLFGII